MQVRRTDDRSDAHIDKGRDGDWAGDGDAVFKIPVQTEVAAGSHELIVRNRDKPAVLNWCATTITVGSNRRPGGGFGNQGSISVSQGNALGAGQISNGRDSSHVEAADIILATEIGSVKRRRHNPALAGNK